MFVVVGDKFRDWVDNFHNFLCNELKKPDPSVLWCYKDSLVDRSHNKTHLRQGKKMMSTKDLTYCKSASTRIQKELLEIHFGCVFCRTLGLWHPISLLGLLRPLKVVA